MFSLSLVSANKCKLCLYLKPPRCCLSSTGLLWEFPDCDCVSYAFPSLFFFKKCFAHCLRSSFLSLYCEKAEPQRVIKKNNKTLAGNSARGLNGSYRASPCRCIGTWIVGRRWEAQKQFIGIGSMLNPNGFGRRICETWQWTRRNLLWHFRFPHLF